MVCQLGAAKSQRSIKKWNLKVKNMKSLQKRLWNTGSILKQLHACACNNWSSTVSQAKKQQKKLWYSLTLAITCFGILLQYCYHCKHYLPAHRISEDQDRNTFKSPDQVSARAVWEPTADHFYVPHILGLGHFCHGKSLSPVKEIPPMAHCFAHHWWASLGWHSPKD